jgi:hypothetical protein
VSDARWGDSLNQPNVGTAWLILIDAASTMGPRFPEAKEVAEAFVGSMTANDIVNVMFFNDRQVVTDSKWQPSSAKQSVLTFVKSVGGTYPSQGRVRPLFNIIKQAATDGFKDLGNAGGASANIQVPLHQAMIVLSNGYAGSDASSTGPGAAMLSDYLTKGRFPEDNTVQPKTPLPVISVWFPSGGFDEFVQNAEEFMQGMSNTDIGGFYDIVRAGQGAAKGAKIVTAVRTRFNQMHIVRWRVSCIAPSVTQTFKLVFTNTQPVIGGDSTFKDVPVGIDPTSWPLDINTDYTQQMVKRAGGIYPGGDLHIYGNFCWGGEKDRAEIYVIPAGMQPPAAVGGTDINAARQAQTQLIASGMKGQVVQASESDVEFQIPDKDKVLSGTGASAVMRVVVYDNKAHRASGVAANSVLTLQGTDKPIPWLLIIGGAFGVVVIALLVVIATRSGSKGRPAAAAAAGPAPVVAQPIIANPGYGHSPPAYGGPSPGFAAPSPYGGPPPGMPASRATLSGSAGVYTVLPGFEMRIGRDAAQCQIVMAEPRISGVHAALKMEAGQLFVRDEQSNNGTYINQARIAVGAWTPVPNGAVLGFGPIELSVRLE